MGDGLLDIEKIKEFMIDPPKPKVKMDLLREIAKNGVDYELLEQLKCHPVDDKNLKEYASLDNRDRVLRLELLVERLMLRVARLEVENECRLVEVASYTVQVSDYIKAVTPMISKLYTHFFGDPIEGTS